ncbi:DNA repair protein endonuclease SAE2/CtIP C-terminus-domain-containing protein [Delphinella strobiligena]|nr:DNA repair protein endonuclease SAE2/CtIP C-terminus-domain-containing protein [Delphinella strobiligena]
MEVDQPSRSKFRPIRLSDSGTCTFHEYAEVVALYSALLHEYRELERRTSEREKRYKEAKKSIKDWNEYIKRTRQKSGAVRDHEQPLTPHFSPVSPAPDQIITPKARVENGHQPPFPSRLREMAAVSTGPLSDSAHSTSTGLASPTLRITSSQTTQGDLSSSGPQPPEEDDDDVPVVVSTRSLKRKRDPTSCRTAVRDVIHGDSTPDRPLLVKEESGSSPMRNISHLPNLLRAETSDLDLAALPDARYDAGIPLEFAPSPTRPSQKPIKPEAAATGQASQDLEQTPRAERTGQHITAPERHSAGPLQPLSNNTPILAQTSSSDRDRLKSNRKRSDRGAAAVHVLSEDGSEPRTSLKKRRLSKSETTPKTSTAYRLADLLEGEAESAAKAVLSPRPGSCARKPRERPEPQLARLSEDSVSERPRSRGKKIVQDRPSPTKQLSRTNSPGPVLPEHEPLRCRPLHRLNIDDFKVDPNYSELGYAYTETIRNRDRRRCLPGCTKDCCSAMRKFAAADLLPHVPRKPGLFDNLDPNLTDDELTLQGYLGGGYSQIIKHATPEEKKQMLIDARTKAFADQHGRHRQVFERRNTPPGFWRTDMPTTQEEEEDREEARRMERQRVEERWREAMRGGGRYVFKDE